jgi:hypothetical protein
MNMALPATTRRATVRAFWLIISGMIGAAVAAMTAYWGATRPLEAGSVAAALLFGLVFARERLVWRLYKGWNQWLVYPFILMAREVVTRLCYFVVFVAVGSAGSRLSLGGSSASRSFWVARPLPDGAARRMSLGSDHAAGGRLGWVTNYLSWALRSGNAWAIVLLPFLAILAALSLPEERTVASNIYTLF